MCCASCETRLRGPEDSFEGSVRRQAAADGAGRALARPTDARRPGHSTRGGKGVKLQREYSRIRVGTRVAGGGDVAADELPVTGDGVRVIRIGRRITDGEWLYSPLELVGEVARTRSGMKTTHEQYTRHVFFLLLHVDTAVEIKEKHTPPPSVAVHQARAAESDRSSLLPGPWRRLRHHPARSALSSTTSGSCSSCSVSSASLCSSC